MGDTVAEVSDWASLLTKSPAGVPLGVVAGAKVIDYNKPLHPAVKRALHLVAAHERRDYRPLLPLGPLQPGWREGSSALASVKMLLEVCCPTNSGQCRALPGAA